MATTAPLPLPQRRSRRLRGQKPLSPSRQVEEEWSGGSPLSGAPPSPPLHTLKLSIVPAVSSYNNQQTHIRKKQRCRDGVINEFLFWCRHPLVYLFHEVTSLHPPSFYRNDFSTCSHIFQFGAKPQKMRCEDIAN